MVVQGVRLAAPEGECCIGEAGRAMGSGRWAGTPLQGTSPNDPFRLPAC